MTIGAALVLLAAGAILRFAVSTVSVHGVDLHIIGDILMVVGLLGLVLWLFVWAPWVRSRRSAYPQRPPLEDERNAADGYPVSTYRPGERRYEDHYPR
jgi:uncharacterized protein DUF6458